MSLDSNILVEPHLRVLTEDRASSHLKLIAAWDGLSIESQIKILNAVKNIPDEIMTKGLASENDYIRYLIADRLHYLYEMDDKKIEKILKDKNLIVKFKARMASDINYDEPEKFFTMSKEEQIMYFSELSIRDGKDIAAIIEWGLNHNIQRKHLNSLIYECSDNFSNFKTDFYLREGEGLEALWTLLTKLGNTEAARALVWTLPVGGFYASDPDIPDGVLNSLGEELLVELLERHDFYFIDFRKKILRSSEKEHSNKVKIAAASVNCKLSKNEFKNLPKEVKESRDVIVEFNTCKIERDEAMNNKITKFAILSLFILGSILMAAGVRNFFVSICIVLPILYWIGKTINEKIDEVIRRIDKKIKSALKRSQKNAY